MNCAHRTRIPNLMLLKDYANCALRIRIPHLLLLIRLLGVAQLCELRTSDTYPASDAAKQICELCTSDAYPALMLLNKYANCALRISIPRLTVLCCLLGVEQLCEMSISGHGDWRVPGGVGCNGKYFA